MATFKVTVYLTVPDNFDEEGVKINVEESLNENVDVENAEVSEIEQIP